MSETPGGSPLDAGPLVETGEGLQPIVLFFAINGVGLGHLTRALSVARHVGGMTPIFVTTCKRAHVLDSFDIPYHYVPSFEELSRLGAAENFSTWNDMLHSFMLTLYDWYRPAGLVTDGMLPFRGLMLAWREHPRSARIGIRRAYKLDGRREVRILERDREYNQLIIPHRRDEAEVPVPDGVPAEWVGPLVVLERDEALPREQARESLGLPTDRPCVLLQLGAGVLGRGKEQERALIDEVASTGAHVVVSSYDAGADRSDERVSVVHRYPMVRYSRAFDLAVAAAGYNTFTELVHHAVPTVFVPNPETMADDQVGRAEAAAAAGAALVGPYDDDAALTKIVLDALADPDGRTAMSHRAMEYLPSSGGRRAGAVVADVCRRALLGEQLPGPVLPPPGKPAATKPKSQPESSASPGGVRRARRSMRLVLGRDALPGRDRAALLAGMVMLRAKAYARAEKLALAVNRRHPEAFGPLELLIQAATRDGRHGDAERWARRATEVQPRDPVPWRRLVSSLEAQGKLDDAVAMAEEFFTHGEDTLLGRMRKRLAGRAHRERGKLALDAGRIDEAMKEVEGALRVNPKDPEAHILRARALRRDGRLADAVKALERARAISGKTDEALERKLFGLMRTFDGSWLPEISGEGARFEPVQRRVLHLLDRSSPHWQSGYTMRSLYTLLAQRDAGFDPVVVTRLGFPEIDRPETHAATQEDVQGIAHHRLLIPGARYGVMADDEYLTRYAAAAASVVEAVHPALLAPATSYHNGLVAMALKQRYGLPMVYELRGFREDSWSADRDRAAGTDLFQGRQRTETRVLLAADRIVTLAEVMKAELVERGIDPDKVSVIPNAVDVDRFAPRPADPGLLASLGLQDRVVLGYISTLAPFEGVDLLLRALGELLAEGSSVGGLIVGDGAELEPLRRLAEELGIAERVKLIGRVPHDRILDYYAAIDVFVVPRLDLRVTRLVTPLKPFEAMAMARALLVSDVDALREVVAPPERGLAFRAGDHRDLAAQARALVQDPVLRRRLGEAARAWVSRERTWRANGERYRAIYEEILSES